MSSPSESPESRPTLGEPAGSTRRLSSGYSDTETQMLDVPEWESPQQAASDEPLTAARATAAHRSDEPPPDLDEPPSRVARHLVSLVLGFALTPVGIGLLAYGGYRYQLIYTDRFVHDDRGLIAFAAGGLLLLIVAGSAAWSPVGALLGGLVYGLVPAGLFLVIPDDVIDWLVDSPLFPDTTEPGTVMWMGVGVCLVVGVTLLGTAFSVVARRR